MKVRLIFFSVFPSFPYELLTIFNQSFWKKYFKWSVDHKPIFWRILQLKCRLGQERINLWMCIKGHTDTRTHGHTNTRTHVHTNTQTRVLGILKTNISFLCFILVYGKTTKRGDLEMYEITFDYPSWICTLWPSAPMKTNPVRYKKCPWWEK